ncbi:MAG TPA: DUF481 domain-containing protein [Cyclobacteriaceae bacterium]|nr:DUF481 domain-containing protein [Cyclobacteriaceae bacterium]
MKKFILGIILLGSLSHTAAAQLNESDSINWQLKFNATGSVLDGNVARTLLLQRFEVAHANTRWGVSSRNDYQYGRTRYILTENDVISYNFVYLHPLSRVYPYFMALVETNYRRNIGFRYQTGPGVSWNVVRKKDHAVKLSLTGTYEYTRYGGNQFDEAVYNGNNIIETWRVTGRVFGKHRLSSALRVSYEFWWQQSLDQSVNYRYHTEEAIEFPVSKHVAFRTGLRYSYENIELQGLKPFDLYWTYGLTITN